MKLYHQPRTRSSRVAWLLHELGIRFEVVPVNVFAGEGRRASHLEVHPHGFVPALEDDGLVMIESSAICMHLADKYGEGKLAPAVGTRERARYYEWMVYVPATVDPCLETVMFHTVFLPEDKRLPQLAARAKKTWGSKIQPRITAAIARSPFVLGDAFSAADILVGSTLTWAKMAGVLEPDPDAERYLEAITKRPAFIAAHEG